MKKLLFLILVSIFTFTVKAQTASANNVQLHHNVDLNGRIALKATYTLSCTNARGHELIPILFIDRAKGVPHYYRDGRNMKQEGPVYRANNEWESTYWESDGQFIAIFNDYLNPLPGKNEYNARILVYDKTLGYFIGDVPNVPWISFVMEGAQSINQSSTGLLIDQTSVDPSLLGPTFNYSGSSIGGTHQYHNPGNSNSKQEKSYNKWEATTVYDPCSRCSKSGNCPGCKGSGKQVAYGNRHLETCSTCHGSGRCPTCNGSGQKARIIRGY